MKKLFLSITMIAIAGFSNLLIAQTPNWAWAKTADGNVRVTTDSSGNVFVTGTFSSSTITFGAFILNNAGGMDSYIVKYDVYGNVLWAKSAGGTGSDQVNSMATDIHGNVYITGTFSSTALSFDTTTINNSGGSDLFIAKYDSGGNVIWAKNVGGLGSAQVSDFAVGVGGNLFITGKFDSPTINFDTITLTNSGSANAADVFIVKYDSVGNALWAKSAAGNVGINTVGSDQAYSVATDAGGNVFIAGIFASLTITFDTITLTNNTSTSVGWNNSFIAKYDGTGNLLWVKNVDGKRDDRALSASTDSSGNLFVTGYFDSDTMTIGSTFLIHGGGPSSKSLFIVKYNSSGNVIWAQKAGYPWINSYAYGYSVTTDAGGNVFVAGSFESPTITFGTVTLTSAGYMDGFIVKYDANGNALWGKSLGGTYSEYVSDIATTTGGSIYTIGKFNSDTLAFGTTLLTHTAPGFFSYNGFIAKLGSTGTTGVVEPNDYSAIVIAPNPFTDQTTISFKKEQKNTTVKIIDVLGKEIKNITFSGNHYLIEKGEMKAGIYFVQVIDENKKVMSRKIIME